MHRIKEIYRGDPVTMFIYSDEDGVKGTKGFTCLNHRSILATEPYATCETCGSDMKPVHFVNRANGEDQYLLAVQTRNMDSMRAFWRGVKEKMEADPHFIPVMGVEGEGGKGAVEWIKFMDSLKEMDYISVKDDLRDRISAFYGVSKVFMADSTASGGLNNEGMQILVTNRAVQMAQTVYNNLESLIGI